METDNIFTKIGDTITAAGKEGINKAKDIRDYAMLVASIKEKENIINRKFSELGRAYYQDNKDKSDVPYAEVADIKEAFAKIEELKKSKDDLRGIRRCPECGAALAADSGYCHKCGVKLPEIDIYSEEEVLVGEVEESEAIKAAKKVAADAKDKAGKVAAGAKDAAGKVAAGAKDAADKVAAGAKDAAEKVAAGAKKTTKKVAEDVRDAADKVAKKVSE